MNLFKLYASLTIDTGEYEKAVKGANADAGKLSESLVRVQKSAGTLATKLKSGLVASLKAVTAATAAASVAVGVLVKNSVDGFAEYEQLAGGVETLFKESSNAVLNYAEQAYRRQGLTANQYMETVTGFSASLLQSLNGDTAAAAKVADTAITDMSDNANKMGTSMEMIQNAYQGFAKANYTMLDNLKLGYGGTKEEMQRLLKDAEAISGIEYDLSSYADVIDAIHVIQTEMGITGTTAKEAASTISGSVATAKAAWSNLVAGMANENANLKALSMQFADSVAVAAGNILPRIQQALSGIGTVIAELAPVVVEALPGLIDAVVPGMISAAGSLISAIGSALPGLIMSLVGSASQALSQLFEALATNTDGAASMVFQGLADAAAQIPGAFQAIIDKGAEFIAWLSSGSTGADVFKSAVLGVASAFAAFKTALAIKDVIDTAAAALTALNAVLAANPVGLVITAILGLVAAITYLWNTCEPFREFFINLWESVSGTVSQAWNTIASTLSGAWNWLLPQLQGAWESISKTISDKWNEIAKNTSETWNGIKKTLSDLWNATKTHAKETWNGITSSLTKFWGDLSGAASEKWNEMTETIGSAWDTVAGKATEIWTSITSTVTGKWDELSGSASTIWNNIKSSIGSAIEGARDLVSNAIDRIKGFFQFEFKWPRLKMPHFKFSGSWNPFDWPEKFPSIGVEWYKKAMGNPMLLNRATIFGQDDETGKYLAGGEAGPEVVSGANTLMRMIDGAVRSAMGAGGVSITQNIYSEAKTAADLMEEARYSAERAVLGV